MYRQKNELCLRPRLPDFAHSFNSVQNRHTYISYNNVRAEAPFLVDQGRTIRGCPHDIKMGRQECKLGFKQSHVVIG